MILSNSIHKKNSNSFKDQRFRLYYTFFSVLLAGVLMSGCDKKVAVKTGYDFTGIKTVCVLDFVDFPEESNSGEAVADEIVKHLIIAGVNVIDRSILEKQIKAQNLIIKQGTVSSYGFSEPLDLTFATFTFRFKYLQLIFHIFTASSISDTAFSRS